MTSRRSTILAICFAALVLAWLLRLETIASAKGGVFLLNRWTGEVFFYDYRNFRKIELKEKPLSNEEVFGTNKPVTFDDTPIDPNHPALDYRQPSGQTTHRD